MSPSRPSPHLLKIFGVSGEPMLLAGGEGRTNRVGETVLKHIDEGREEESPWLAKLRNP